MKCSWNTCRRAFGDSSDYWPGHHSEKQRAESCLFVLALTVPSGQTTARGSQVVVKVLEVVDVGKAYCSGLCRYRT